VTPGPPRRRRWAAGLLAGLCGWTLGGATPARAAPVNAFAVAGPGASVSTYATPLVVASVSGSLTFVNLDDELHDIVSVEEGADHTPLFSTHPVGFGTTALVRGLSHLTPGKAFAFTCTIHTAMHGTLVAVP